MRRRHVAALLIVFSACSFAQNDASRPLRMIIPFPAGGGSDAIGRIIAPRLSERFGQQVVVDNRAGAGGSIGTEAAVRASPDGHTLALASTSEIAINPALYKLSYDTLRDLTPVAMVASAAMVVIVAPTSPAGTVKELIALAKAKSINVASAGNGTITHLSGELFRSMTHLNWTHVPYKGAPPALTDVAGGRVEAMFSSLPAAIPIIKSNRVKAIAVSTRSRVASLPDVPTVIESGVSGYDVVYWYGIFVPAATPASAVARLAQETERSLKQNDVVTNLANQGASPGEMTQPQFAQFVRAEYQRWTQVVKTSGAKAD
jgi:tripartite-type tricarboxylate transporter receptor subunit TctC